MTDSRRAGRATLRAPRAECTRAGLDSARAGALAVTKGAIFWCATATSRSLDQHRSLPRHLVRRVLLLRSSYIRTTCVRYHYRAGPELTGIPFGKYHCQDTGSRRPGGRLSRPERPGGFQRMVAVSGSPHLVDSQRRPDVPRRGAPRRPAPHPNITHLRLRNGVRALLLPGVLTGSTPATHQHAERGMPDGGRAGADRAPGPPQICATATTPAHVVTRRAPPTDRLVRRLDKLVDFHPKRRLDRAGPPAGSRASSACSPSIPSAERRPLHVFSLRGAVGALPGACCCRARTGRRNALRGLTHPAQRDTVRTRPALAAAIGALCRRGAGSCTGSSGRALEDSSGSSDGIGVALEIADGW